MTQTKEEPGFLSRLLTRAPSSPAAASSTPPPVDETDGPGLFTKIVDLFSLNKNSDTPPAVLALETAPSSSNAPHSRSPSKRGHGKSRHKPPKPVAITENPLLSVIPYLENALWELYENPQTAASIMAAMPEHIKKHIPKPIEKIITTVSDFWNTAQNDHSVICNETCFIGICFSFATGNQLVTDLQTTSPDSQKPRLYHHLRDSIKQHFPEAPNKWESPSVNDAETAKGALRRYLEALVYYADYLDALNCRQKTLSPLSNLPALTRSLLEALITTYPTLNTDEAIFVHWKPFLTLLEEAIDKLPHPQQASLTAVCDAIGDHLNNGRISQFLPGRTLSQEKIEPLVAGIQKGLPKDGELTREALSEACSVAENLGEHLAAFTKALQERAALDAAEAAAKKELEMYEAQFATELQAVRNLLEKHKDLLTRLNKAIGNLYGLPVDHPGQENLHTVNMAFKHNDLAEAFKVASFTTQVSSSSSSSSTMSEPHTDRSAWLKQTLSENEHTRPQLEALISGAETYISWLTEIFNTESKNLLSQATALEDELGRLLNDPQAMQRITDEARSRHPIADSHAHLMQLKSEVNHYCECLTSLFVERCWTSVRLRLIANYTKTFDHLRARIIQPLEVNGQSDNPYTSEIKTGNESLKEDISALRERLSELTFENRTAWEDDIRQGLIIAERALARLELTREKEVAWQEVQEKIAVLEACQHHLTFRNHYHQRNFCRTLKLNKLDNELVELIGHFKGLLETLREVSTEPALACHSRSAITNMATWRRAAAKPRHNDAFDRCTASAHDYIDRFREHDKRLRNQSLGKAEEILETIRGYQNWLASNDPRNLYLNQISDAVTRANDAFLDPNNLLENRSGHQQKNPYDAYRQELSSIVTRELQNDLERFSDGENCAFYQWVRRYIFYPLQCIGNLCSGNRFFVTWGATSLERKIARLGHTHLNPTPPKPRQRPIRDEDDGFQASDDESVGHGYRPSNTPGTIKFS